MDPLTYQVSISLGDHLGDYNISAVVSQIQRQYGSVTSIDEVPSPEYWAIVESNEL